MSAPKGVRESEGSGGLAPSPSADVPKIARYEILSKLASGGMAEIFIAQRHGSDDICVIKQLHDHLAKDPVVANRFLREAQVAFYLDHPNIARIIDADFSGKNVYLAMEFIGGQDIESMMFKLMEQQKMLPPALSVTATRRVLEGLAYAHEHRGPDGRPLEIVHRDLSPRNVMITYAGDVKIIDFGLARTNLGEFRTAPGMVLGTLRYMSPEQAVAEPVDRRSDLYTWAVVLYEMLSGRPLVMGANAHEVLHAVVTQVPRPLSSLNPTLPKTLDPVLERGLAKDRRDRFPNAQEFLDALTEAAGGLDATEEQIGAFVADLFPDDYVRAETLLEHVRNGESLTIEPTRYEVASDLARAQTVVAALPSGPITPAKLPSVQEASRVFESPRIRPSQTVPPTYIPAGSGTYLLDRTELAPPPPARRRPNPLWATAILSTIVMIGTLTAVFLYQRPETPIVAARPKGTQAPQAAPVAITASSHENLEVQQEEQEPAPAPRLEKKRPAVKAKPAKAPAPQAEPASADARGGIKEPPRPATPYDQVSKLIDQAEREYNANSEDRHVGWLISNAQDILIELRDPRQMGCVNNLIAPEMQETFRKFRHCLAKIQTKASP
jgi:eukaryotic-like serine/threonine-protein kinase